MSKPLGRHSARNTSSETRKRRLMIAAAVLLLLILLLVFAPALLVLLCVPLFIIALVALSLGELWWARIPNRGVAGGILAGALVLFIVSAIVYGIRGPVSDAAPRPATATAASTASAAPDLASFVADEP